MKYAIYARVSTTKQEFDRQVSELKKYIYNDGGSDDDIVIYAEKVSGAKKKNERPEFTRLLSDIEENPDLYKCLYLSELSRLGRDSLEIKQTVTRLTELKQQTYLHTMSMYFLNEQKEMKPSTQIILAVLGEIAEAEAKMIRERVISGLRHSAESGNIGGGAFQPYGYKRESETSKKMVIEPTEADVIKRIYKLYSEGTGAKAITTILNNDNVPTRSKLKYNKPVKWSDNTVLSIIKNSLYKGVRIHNPDSDNPVIVDAPIIIEPALWNKCNEIRLNKTHKNYLTNYTFLLRHVATCGVCGRNYFAKYKPAKHGDKVYICSSRLKSKGNCGNSGLNISLLESAIYNEMITSKDILNYMMNSDDIIKQLKKDIEAINTTIDNLVIELQDEQKKLDRCDDAFFDGILPKNRYQKKRSGFESNINNIAKRHAKALNKKTKLEDEIANRESIEVTAETLASYKDNREQLEKVFKTFIGKVVINTINTSYALATVYIGANIDVTDMKQFQIPMKLLLYTGGMRKKNKEYKYYSLYNELSVKYDDKYTLLTPLADIEYYIHLIKENEIDILEITIPANQILKVELNKVDIPN